MSNNWVVMAIPAKDDPIWQLSSEKIPHITLAFLGERDESDPALSSLLFEVATTAAGLTKFGLPVLRRGVLGDESADVLFFDEDYIGRLRRFRSQLLRQPTAKSMYESTKQFPTWTPHLTLGFPTTPAANGPVPNWINFDRIAIWTGENTGPELYLRSDPRIMSDTLEGEDDFEHTDFVGNFISHAIAGSDAVAPNAKFVEGNVKRDGRGRFSNSSSTQRDWVKNRHDLLMQIGQETGPQIAAEEARLKKKFGITGNLNENAEAHKQLQTYMHKTLNAAAERVGKSPDGDFKLVYEYDSKSPTGFNPQIVSTKVKHADIVGHILAGGDLKHAGVKGMKWGVRKDVHVVGSTSLAAGNGIVRVISNENPKKPKAPLATGDEASNVAKSVQSVASKMLVENLDKTISTMTEVGKKYSPADVKSNPDIRRQYHHEVSQALTKYAQTHAPKGAKAFVRVDGDQMDLYVGSKAWYDQVYDGPIYHAEGPEGASLSFRVLRDDNGFIIGFDPLEPFDNVTHSEDELFDYVADYLAGESAVSGDIVGAIIHANGKLWHHGVKGMKWGVRRTAAQLGNAVRSKLKKSGGSDEDAEPTKKEAKAAAAAKDTFVSADAERFVKTRLKEGHEMSTREIKEALERARLVNDYQKAFGNDPNQALKQRVEALELQRKYSQLSAELNPTRLQRVRGLVESAKPGFEAFKKLDEATGNKMSDHLLKSVGLPRPGPGAREQLREQTGFLQDQVAKNRATKDLEDSIAALRENRPKVSTPSDSSGTAARPGPAPRATPTATSASTATKKPTGDTTYKVHSMDDPDGSFVDNSNIPTYYPALNR